MAKSNKDDAPDKYGEILLDPFKFKDFDNVIPPPSTHGYVYFLTVPELIKGQPEIDIKIGCAVNIRIQVSNIQAGNPYLLDVYKVIIHSDYINCYNQIVKELEKKKGTVEGWYKVSYGELARAIEKLGYHTFIRDIPRKNT
jgi:hypothetical protein